MNVDDLVPRPDHRLRFRLSDQKFVPNQSGCYVLSTFAGEVLYIGLTVNLFRRVGDHLDSPAKTAETALGRAIWFHWLETVDRERVERTWMNIHIQHEGCLPVLNRAYSPTGT
jgi:hypothetical protein